MGMADRYVRNMRGYGPNPPDARWPGGAKVAVSFVVNYEEGGENNVLHGDAASEAFLSEIVGAAPWPGKRHWNMESIYEYGARVGFWRLHRLFTRSAVPVTVYGVATALARSPEQVEAMKAADWEIASHGLRWIDYRDHAEADEARDLAEAIRLHTQVVGERPTGLYLGRTSSWSVRLAANDKGFVWISDTYDDDLPYWLDHDGHGNAIDPQLVLPYTLDANDMRFATPQGFNTGEQFFTYLKDAFDTHYAEGAEGRPSMMTVGLHCRLIGRPGRFAALRIRGAILDELRRQDWRPRQVRQQAHKVRDAIRELTRQLGHTPSDEEIKAFTGLDEKDYQAFLWADSSEAIESLDELLQSGHEHFPDAAELFEERLLKERLLEQALSRLDERERLVLTLYYQHELSLKEIALVLEVSDARVCQLSKQAIGKACRFLGSADASPAAAAKRQSAL